MSNEPQRIATPDYLSESPMVRMAGYFDDLATGRTQVPRQQVVTLIRDRITDPEVLRYHDLMVPRTGPLFTHFLASIPCILEEMARVGVALSRLSLELGCDDARPFTFYELDAFDGSQGRSLAAHAAGRIRTLTNSPNKANERHFRRFADAARSAFFPSSFLLLDHGVIEAQAEFSAFRGGFDAIYETAAFQFYGRERGEQIAHAARLLKEDGLMFFLEKLNHPDPAEYERRERAKDEGHKSLYFTAEEIAWKRQQMLAQMETGQVEFAELVAAIRTRFRHVVLLWNSTNFHEFVACNDKEKLDRLLALLPPVAIPVQYCFDDRVMKDVGASA